MYTKYNISALALKSNFSLPPANEVLGQGVCLFTRRGASESRGVYPLQTCTHPWIHPHPRSTSGQYAFYWNAFLFIIDNIHSYISAYRNVDI